MNLPSYADAPFHAPLDPVIGGIIIDLPSPPSVNRLWRVSKSSVIKSDVYRQWVKSADETLMATAQMRGVKTIVGKFTAIIVVKRSNKDLDNHSKAVLDFLQSRCFVENDKFCEELTLRWGDAPMGCRVTVRPCT